MCDPRQSQSSHKRSGVVFDHVDHNRHFFCRSDVQPFQSGSRPRQSRSKFDSPFLRFMSSQIGEYFTNVFHSFFTLFGSMFKRFSFDPYLGSERSISVTLFFSFFLFLNTVTFYNLIASIIVSSHRQVKKESFRKNCNN